MRRVVALTVLGSLACGSPGAAPARPVPVPEPEPAPPRLTVTPMAAPTRERVAPALPRTPAASAVPTSPPPPEVATMLAEIDARQIQASVTRLVGFGTRHTLSDAVSETRGVGAARRWIKAELEAAAQASGRTGEQAMQVSFDGHTVKPDGKRIDRAVEVVNVLAVLPGSLPEARARRYYVVGHYDSRASDVMDASSDAPGANDDASGTALVLELARVLARHEFDATLVFMASAGEEQGLLGARRHAIAAKAAGLQIDGVLSNDIVGDPGDPRGGDHRTRVRVFSEGVPATLDAAQLQQTRQLAGFAEAPSRQLARHVAEVAAREALVVQPWLIARPDRFLRGGDHLAFTELGYPAVRFTEVAEKYDRQHQDVRVVDGREYGDTLEHVDAAYVAEVARVNAAALAHLARAPSRPGAVELVADSLAGDTTLRWRGSPEPDVAGYEVLWRGTTAADWEHAEDVGLVETATVPHSKDDWLFAVRAYDREGYRSPAVFPALAATK